MWNIFSGQAQDITFKIWVDCERFYEPTFDNWTLDDVPQAKSAYGYDLSIHYTRKVMEQTSARVRAIEQLVKWAQCLWAKQIRWGKQ